MAFDAVFEVLDAFFQMFAPHLVRPVLVASIAGVAVVVVVDMARLAGDVVIAVQHEEFCMIKGGRFPCLCLMTLDTAPRNLPVQIVGGRAMAAFTLFAHVGAQKFMRKGLAHALRG